MVHTDERTYCIEQTVDLGNTIRPSVANCNKMNDELVNWLGGRGLPVAAGAAMCWWVRVHPTQVVLTAVQEKCVSMKHFLSVTYFSLSALSASNIKSVTAFANGERPIKNIANPRIKLLNVAILDFFFHTSFSNCPHPLRFQLAPR